MELTILTHEHFSEIIKRLDTLNENLNKKNAPASEKFVDNSEFLFLMKISKRTAQTWRDQGKISFTQIGNKIYYLMADVEVLMKEHYIKAFNPTQRNKY